MLASKGDGSGNTDGTDTRRRRELATVERVKSRRRAAVGAIGATVLLLTATACASDSDGSSAGSSQDTSVENTVAAPEAPSTDAASETTAAPTAETTEPERADDDPAPTEPAVVVPEALQFTAPLVGGGTFDGAAAAATGKPTVFWFWAPT